MNGECLSHLLTDEERAHFEKQGYLYVPNALPTEMRERLLEAVDKLHNNALATGRAKPDTHWGFSNFLRFQQLKFSKKLLNTLCQIDGIYFIFQGLVRILNLTIKLNPVNLV